MLLIIPYVHVPTAGLASRLQYDRLEPGSSFYPLLWSVAWRESHVVLMGVKQLKALVRHGILIQYVKRTLRVFYVNGEVQQP